VPEKWCLPLYGEKKMIGTFLKRLLSTALSFLLVFAALPMEAGAQQAAPTGPAGYSGEGTPMSANELQQLVAPIALYPDALVAQVLGAATFPDQVAYASDWLQQNKNLSGKNPDAGRRCAAVGPQREGAHTVPVCPRQPGEEPELGLSVRGGVPHSGR
jgi:Protein of unknown function (DUF3300)